MWGRTLSDGWALAFINNGAAAINVTCGAACFEQLLGSTRVKAVDVRDLWLHTSVARLQDTGAGFSFAGLVAGDGGVRLFKITALARSSAQGLGV